MHILQIPDELHFSILEYAVDTNTEDFLQGDNLSIFRTCRAMQNHLLPFVEKFGKDKTISHILREKLKTQKKLVPAQSIFSQIGTNVEALDLEGIQTRANNLPARIATCFPKLRVLNLNDTYTANRDFEPLSRQQMLEELFLNDGRFLTDESFEPITRIFTLTVLHIEGAKSLTNSTLERIGTRLTHLTSLHIKNCTGFTGDGFRHIAHLKLTSLNCEGLSSLTGSSLQEIAKIRTLTYLNLSSARCIDDEELTLIVGLTELQTLELNSPSKNLTGTSLALLSQKLLKLKKLNLRDSKHLQNSAYHHLAEFRELETLDLKNGGVSNHGLRQIARITTLIHLDLQGEQSFSNEGLLELFPLQKLKTLYLTKIAVHDSFQFSLITRPSKNTLETLKKNLPNLTITASKKSIS